MRMMGECNYLLEFSRNRSTSILTTSHCQAVRLRFELLYLTFVYGIPSLPCIASGLCQVLGLSSSGQIGGSVLARVLSRHSSYPMVCQDALFSQPRLSLSSSHWSLAGFWLPVGLFSDGVSLPSFLSCFLRGRVVFEVSVLLCGVLGTFGRYPLKLFDLTRFATLRSELGVIYPYGLV